MLLLVLPLHQDFIFYEDEFAFFWLKFCCNYFVDIELWCTIRGQSRVSVLMFAGYLRSGSFVRWDSVTGFRCLYGVVEVDLKSSRKVRESYALI